MICLACDNEEFVENPDAVLEQDYKGMILHVKSPAVCCTKCGWTTLRNDQIDELRRKTDIEYQRRLREDAHIASQQ